MSVLTLLQEIALIVVGSFIPDSFKKLLLDKVEFGIALLETALRSKDKPMMAFSFGYGVLPA